MCIILSVPFSIGHALYILSVDFEYINIFTSAILFYSVQKKYICYVMSQTHFFAHLVSLFTDFIVIKYRAV
jgi:phospholipid N-methyltransferase